MDFIGGRFSFFFILCARRRAVSAQRGPHIEIIFGIIEKTATQDNNLSEQMLNLQYQRVFFHIL